MASGLQLQPYATTYFRASPLGDQSALSVTFGAYVGTNQMADVIDDPVINSPYDEPASHFAFGEEGITANRVNGRRESEFFIPVPPPKHMSAKEQLEFDVLHLQRERNQLI